VRLRIRCREACRASLTVRTDGRIDAALMRPLLAGRWVTLTIGIGPAGRSRARRAGRLRLFAAIHSQRSIVVRRGWWLSAWGR
jgi:hypothetical protein